MIDKDIPVLDLELYLDGKKAKGFDAIAYVSDPAIEQKGITLSKHKVLLKMNERQQVVAPLLIPDKLIYRNDEAGEYYIKARKDVIKELREDAQNKINELNIFKNTHEGENPEKAFVLSEWIIEDENDITYTKYNFSEEDVPVGSWMVHSQVLDSELWEDIKENGKNAYSIEAFLNMKLVNLNKIKKEKEVMEENKELIALRKELEETKKALLELQSQKEEEIEAEENKEIEAGEKEEEIETKEHKEEEIEAIEEKEEEIEAMEEKEEEIEAQEEEEIEEPVDEEDSDEEDSDEMEEKFEEIYEEISKIKAMISELKEPQDEPQDRVEMSADKKLVSGLTKLSMIYSNKK